MSKFAFVSSVNLGLESLKELVKLGHRPIVVITQDLKIVSKKSGGANFSDFCREHNLLLKKIRHINDNKIKTFLRKCKIDWLFIIGWSQLADNEILKIPSLGSIGIHPTLLPKGRGRAPIPWAIIKNLKYTGVTLFLLKKGADQGNIIDQARIKIDKNETSTSLYKKVINNHKLILKKNIKDIFLNNFKLKKQNNKKASYWPKRSFEDGELSTSFSVLKASRYVRALTEPYPGAFIRIGDKKLIIWKASISKKKPKSNFIKFKDGFLKIAKYSQI
tara:strand:+ start:10814 stop:11638 length:825 start_codon:yes stop_codon:yes gene_type:complete